MFRENDKVTIHSLGPSYPGKEFKARIKGLSVAGIARIWIVELIDKIDASYAYTHCTMPEACLREGWNHGD